MPRTNPKLLSTCGERLFEISRNERIASSITAEVEAINSRFSSLSIFFANTEIDILADESSGPIPSCNSRE